MGSGLDARLLTLSVVNLLMAGISLRIGGQVEGALPASDAGGGHENSSSRDGAGLT